MDIDAPACPRCGSPVPADAKFCASCGYSRTRLSPGQTLDGKYEILEKIGEGGMGEVYKARHIHLEEVRIIKVTKPDPLGEGLEPRRFQEEARIATLVRHPNVAALYDFSRLPDGSYYMVWEFIDGITLEQWLRRRGPLPASRAIDVTQQLLAGLSQIHAAGIVHRDLSPDNIMIREAKDGRLIAKIIDLGIAKRVAASTLEKMTGTGMFLGKLKYCSPEQAGSLSSGETVDGRSDLYSLGVVLYEMLSGKPPFESQTPEGYLGKHLHVEAPPLDTSRLPAAIGPALASIVRQALAKNREHRFRDAEEFSRALSRLRPASTEPIDAGPTRQIPRRRSVSPVWILAAILTVAVAAAVFVVRRPAARPPASVETASMPAPTPRRSPTTSADEIVVAPRILEDTPAVAAPTAIAPAPSRVPTRIPTLAPTAAPTPKTFVLPNGKPLTEALLKRWVDNWTTLPLEKRAGGAVRISYLSRYWIAEHSGEPFAAQLQRMLPKTLLDDANTAESEKRPGLAVQFLLGYLEVNPTDSDALTRLNALKEKTRENMRRRDNPQRDNPQP